MSRPRIAVYLSRHGYGHLTRAAAVLERLVERVPAEMTVIAPQPADMWPSCLQRDTEWIDQSCDVGVVQSDDVTVDEAATGAALSQWLAHLPGIVDRERRRLGGGFDLVLGDVPPPAFEAASLAGVPSIALANFSWDWIYRELGFEAAAAASASMYAKADLLLETAPAAPMPAFARRRPTGLIARRAVGRRSQTRASLGIGDGEHLVLLALRPDSAALVRLPAPSAGVFYVLPAGWPPAIDRNGVRDDVLLARSLEFAALIDGADVVVGKPGYGLIGDVAASATRLLWVPRPGFPENAVLEGWLENRRGMRRISADALRTGAWLHDVLALLDAPRTDATDLSAAGLAAGVLADVLRGGDGRLRA